MAKERAIEFLKLLDTDEALSSRVREKALNDVAEIARGLSFDVTEEELAAAITELKAERARQQMPQKMDDAELDKLSAGVFGDGENAPDGHEMGCMLSWHGNEWQEKNKIYCSKQNLCDKYFHVCLMQPNRSHNPYMDS